MHARARGAERGEFPATARVAAQGAGRLPAPPGENFLAVATPGAGKTTFALRIAAELLADGTIDAVTVVTPTEHLKTQWSKAAGLVGIQLDDAFRNADVHSSHDFHGAVVTYAQVGMAPAIHRRRTMTRRTLVILDEIHHAGDSRSWGDGVKAAFEPAVRRLMLTGTPFRSDDNPIPFVDYERGGDGLLRSRSDSSYGYADALADGVVRPVIFLAYSGETRWRTSAGDELAARLGEPMTQDLIAQAWRTALDPSGDWMPQVLRAADARLQVLAGRRHARRRRSGDRDRPADRPGVREAARRDHRREGRRRALRRRRRLRADRRVRRAARSAGWSPCGWCPRASTSRAWPSASTRPAPPRRCSSPRRSAASCGPASRGRPRRSSCPASATCSSWPATWRSSATTCSARPKQATASTTICWSGRSRNEEASGELETQFEALSATAELDQVIFDGASFGTPVPGRHARGGGVPRHSPGC